jgi:hypothetical protein
MEARCNNQVEKWGRPIEAVRNRRQAGPAFDGSTPAEFPAEFPAGLAAGING